MMLFWIVVAGMIVVALVAIAPSLLYKRELRSLDRDGQNVDIARERLAELDLEQQQGALSQEEHAQAKAELEQALLIDLDMGESREVAIDSWRAGRLTLWSLAIVVPLFTVLIYLYVGSPELVDMSAKREAGAANQAVAPKSMEEMITSLKQRLQESPEDPNGWFMLGRSYMATEQYPQAAKAFARVNDLVGGEESAVLLALANALILSNKGDMAGEPTELVRQAVTLAPDSSTALWLAGAVERAAGNHKQALTHWRRLLPLIVEDQESEEKVRSLIAELEGSVAEPETK